MPEKFLKAIAAGAKVRTKKLSGGRYVKIAIKKSGKTVAGEIHSKRKKKKR